MNLYFTGFYIGLFSLLIIIILDILSYNYIKHVNVYLYMKALLFNIFHLLILSPVLYTFTSKYLCSVETQQFGVQCIKCFCILYTQSVLYYYIHILMHKPDIYSFIHKFHHQFNTFVVPISANAVTIQEYLLAYMFPIIISAYIFSPDYITLNISILFISLSNILIHTPIFRYISMIIPDFLVNTDKHMTHHKMNNKHYSAPIINWDYFFIKKIQ